VACFELLIVKYLELTDLFPKPNTAEVKTPQKHSSTKTFQLGFQRSLQVTIVIKNKKSYFGYNKRKEGYMELFITYVFIRLIRPQ